MSAPEKEMVAELNGEQDGPRREDHLLRAAQVRSNCCKHPSGHTCTQSF